MRTPRVGGRSHRIASPHKEMCVPGQDGGAQPSWSLESDSDNLSHSSHGLKSLSDMCQALLASNSLSSFPSLPSAGITGVSLHTWLEFYF
jgi:hypothetical protein